MKRIIFSILRVWLGYKWIIAGWKKITSPIWTGDKAGVAVRGFLQGALEKTSGPNPEVHDWYASFIENVALPNAKIFSYMVSFGELLAGVALILGAFTLFAALGSIFMNLNYLWSGTSSSNPEMLIVGILLVIFFIQAGYYGIDYFINRMIFHKYYKHYPKR